MPIDFEAIAAPFRIQYFLQRRTVNQAFLDLGNLFAKRRQEVEARERQTQDLPIFFFSGEALSVWLDESQHGVLGLGAAPEPISWEAAASPFKAFWAGLLTAKTMVESEQVLPDFLAALAAGVHLIAASMERFKEPGPALFQVQAKRPAADLFGQAALFFKLINDPATATQVSIFVHGALEMILVLRKLFPPGAEEETPGLPLSEATLIVAGAALALPTGARLLGNIAGDLQLVFQLELLKRFREIEESVFEVRRTIIDLFFVDLRRMGREILEWLQVTEAFTACSVNFYDRVIRDYLDDVVNWFKTFGPPLKDFADGLVKLLKALGPYSERLLAVDIGSAISHGIISFTIGDLDDPLKILELIASVRIIEALASEVSKGLSGLPPIQRRIDALKIVLGFLYASTAIPMPPEAMLPEVSKLPRFPNIYDAFFGTGALDLPDSATRMAEAKKNAETLGSTFTNLGKAAKTNVDSMLSAGVDSLQTMSVTFAKSGSLAAQMGSAQRYRQVIERSNSLADTAVNWKEFQGTAQSYQDPLAEAMAVWLADSHFELLTKTLPLYVAEMIEYWRQEIKKPVAEQPTSPHILAKRAKVERVRVPRLTLRVTGERILDKSLALEVATQFQGAVAEAYRLGVDQQVQAGG